MATAISPDLKANEQAIRQALGNSADVQTRRFTAGPQGHFQGLLVCIEGLVDEKSLEDLLASATHLSEMPFQPPVSSSRLEQFAQSVMPSLNYAVESETEKIVDAVLKGETALFLQREEKALTIDLKTKVGRSIEEPSTEAEIRGPRDGFVEALKTNTALIRRRVRDPGLRFESFTIGDRSKTEVRIAYIEPLAARSLVDEVRRRIQRVKIDALSGAGQLDEFLQDNPLSPFAPNFATERPDRVAGNLLEGRVAILTDGTPFALIVPTTFWSFLHAAGDYYNHFLWSTSLRLVRLLALLSALTLSSVYVMLTTHHHEMLPTPLALAIAGGREGVPMPTVAEVLGMELMFEVLQEAGLRLPKVIGQTVSIVGALVIGQASVQAGLVSPATVVVVATSGITSFAIPNYATSLTIRLLRFPLVILAAALGIFGFVGGTTVLALHLASLRNFGVPYLAPIAPLKGLEQQDTLLRAPWWSMIKRPNLGAGRSQRTKKGSGPKVPQSNGGQGR